MPVSRKLRASSNVAGHPEISWSVVLDAELAGPIDASLLAARLAAAWPSDGRAGPTPGVVRTDGADHEAALGDAADRTYVDGSALCRVLVRAEGPPRITIAAHHAALDGLGLVAVLGAAIGEPLGTSARGAGTASPAGRWVYPLSRLGEALFRPPARVAPVDGDRGAAGDHLLRAAVSCPIRSVELVGAAAGAVRRWNAERGRNAARLVVAIGAARTPGISPRIGTQAAWFRVAVTVADPDRIQEALRCQGPEPRGSIGALQAARRAGLSRALGQRLGSTLLVSHLASLTPSEAVATAAFYPAAHGRSGIAIGGVTVGGTTTVTLRSRRRNFGPDASRALLDLVVGHLDPGIGVSES